MSSSGSGKQEGQSSDPRFSRVYNDPKFKKTSSKNIKIKLDNRFSKKDLEIKKKSKVDKYGRKIQSDSNNKDLNDFDKYFEKDEDEDESKKEEEPSTEPVIDRARGEVPDDYVSSDEYTSSESEYSGESDVESEGESEIEIETTKPEAGEPSNTLAVVNLDWDHVKAEDLFVTLSSFVPKGGKISRISIYPSEFGKERMQREEVEGPPKELFQKKKSKKNGPKDEEESDDDIGIKDLYEEGDADKDFDRKALRQYQLERLRYYYAVVYCNNIETASSIYQNCDGTEFESTANMFDLRFVPDGMTFDDTPRDECTESPKNYKPLQFSTDALQHSNVKLTWDETPADRIAISKRAFSQKEIEDMDFKAYLASDSDHSDEEVDQNSRSKLLSLVGKNFNQKSEEKKDDGEEVDMEITFTPGLEEGSSEKEGEKEENTIEKVRRKEKERRKSRKDKLKQMKKTSLEEKKEKLRSLKDKKNREFVGDSKSRAELELLMMDDNDENTENKINKDAHFNMNEILRSEKEKGKKSKYQNKTKIVEDNFEANLNDPRFKEMFEDRDFAIDPSRPEFKATKTTKKMLEERNKRSKNHSGSNKRSKKTYTNNKKRDNGSDSKSSKSNIQNIVKKLKNKGNRN
ncbi:similar to Saccharomyces cerevisiae YDR365C ESF1 Nucleolar protein involved in pre-rRNA processing [Maudiozyma barnettii]|uniref:Similar to Saccharomyces cerevisiae YDR365C ESF1 Nucleolar protein involved in pre-rRNA processing n=1 Tax=Maudiozyma barnettii TaxID=61262 RepID=A0A8H2ZHB3_9SACH|nr:pre-rRNA-processing protein ESF1 [Kazachstania barnettii]CAB4253758.1 similar to Saccharomyces cerevisiae YDR365C ESF1 Nucleolar protein involved in pre-rRNA processing [Kazachstania barnettii]CAD1781506.1 similar to Saccharomyces cerevisiae YDR365C ESF1 Nucleolar protein involved in pre-rRNA processing [Kazachstania barnettii]